MVNEKIVLIEIGRVIKDDKEMNQHLDEYFATITDSLNIPRLPTSPVQRTGDIFAMLCKNMPVILVF